MKESIHVYEVPTIHLQSWKLDLEWNEKSLQQLHGDLRPEENILELHRLHSNMDTEKY